MKVGPAYTGPEKGLWVWTPLIPLSGSNNLTLSPTSKRVRSGDTHIRLPGGVGGLVPLRSQAESGYHTLYTDLWYKTREWFRFRDYEVARSPRCVLCGRVRTSRRISVRKSKLFLTLHHSRVGYQSWEAFFNPDNVIVVCASCHWKIHKHVIAPVCSAANQGAL